MFSRITYITRNSLYPSISKQLVREESTSSSKQEVTNDRKERSEKRRERVKKEYDNAMVAHEDFVFDTVDDAFNELDNKIEISKNQAISDATTKINDAATQARDELNDAKGELDSKITALQTDANTLRTDQSTLRTDQNTLRTDQSTLRTDQNTLRTNQDTLRGDADKLKKDIETSYVFVGISALSAAIAAIVGGGAFYFFRKETGKIDGKLQVQKDDLNSTNSEFMKKVFTPPMKITFPDAGDSNYDREIEATRKKINNECGDPCEAAKEISSLISRLNQIKTEYKQPPCIEGYCLGIFIPHKSRIDRRVNEIKQESAVYETNCQRINAWQKSV